MLQGLGFGIYGFQAWGAWASGLGGRGTYKPAAHHFSQSGHRFPLIFNDVARPEKSSILRGHYSLQELDKAAFKILKLFHGESIMPE